MARVTYPAPDRIGDATARALEAFGIDLNINRVIAHADDLAPYVIKLAGASFSRITVSPRCRELIALCVARARGNCAYVLTQHKPVLRALGIDPDEVLAGNLSALTDAETALVQALQTRRQSPTWPDETVQSLAGHFTDRQLVEILLLEGIYHLYASVADNLQVDIDDHSAQIAAKVTG